MAGGRRPVGAGLGPGVGRPRGHRHPPSAAVAFNLAGNLLATGCDDDRARVFTIPFEGPGPAPLFDAPPHLASAGVAPLFTGGHDGLLTVTGRDELTWWDARTGRELRKPIQNRVDALAAAPDGRHIATGGWMDAYVWDSSDGRVVSPGLRHRNWVRALAFSPDGRTLMTAGGDRVVRFWRADSGQPAAAELPHQSEVSAAAFSPDG